MRAQLERDWGSRLGFGRRGPVGFRNSCFTSRFELVFGHG